MGSSETVRVVVGRVGRPHGIRGEVAVEVRTDEPDRRFRPDTVLDVVADGPRPATAPRTLTVAATRWHQSRLLVRFAEAVDRTTVEAWRGLFLEVEVSADQRPEDPEEYYDHQLVGLAVEDTQGQPLGEVVAVQHGAAQDLLVVRTPDGREALVPFVAALVPEVDLAARRVVVDDRPGLVSPWASDG